MALFVAWSAVLFAQQVARPDGRERPAADLAQLAAFALTAVLRAASARQAVAAAQNALRPEEAGASARRAVAMQDASQLEAAVRLVVLPLREEEAAPALRLGVVPERRPEASRERQVSSPRRVPAPVPEPARARHRTCLPVPIVQLAV